MDYHMGDKDGDSAWERLLIKAAEVKDLTSLVELLDYGISVDADAYNRSLFYASQNYITPLQIAASNGFLAGVEILIARGADVNAKDRFDVTALHMAAERGHYECLKALLNANAECSFPTKYSKTGYYTAVPHRGGTTPLHLAAAHNNVECVKELIMYGADYNAVDELGRTSLYIAAEKGHERCVVAHLKNAVGRDILSLPSIETSDTPLHFAVVYGMVDCVKELLNSGSDPNHRNFSGNSPLHLAVGFNAENEAVGMKILKMLVLEGFNTDINQLDACNWTPLHHVCFHLGTKYGHRRPSMAKFLIQYGANVNIRSMKHRGISLIEHELKFMSQDMSILQYIVRSMLQLPHFHTLRMRRAQEFPSAAEIFYEQQQLRNHGVLEEFHNVISADIPRHAWYEKMASNPRSLQHHCRYAIRQALGPKSMRHITQLPLPTSLQSYLLLERD